jgi:hypothetical protein
MLYRAYCLLYTSGKLLLQEDVVTRQITQAVRGKVWDRLAKDTDSAGEGQLALEICGHGLDDPAVGGGDVVSVTTVVLATSNFVL